MTETTTSPARQRRDCVRLVEEKGWDFDPATDVYEDWDRSAFTGRKRPGFDRMMDGVRRGLYQRVVVWRVDRLSRSFSTWAKVFSDLESTGAVVVSASEGQSSDSGGYFKLLAVLAEEESQRIRARVRSARAAQFEEGRWPGGNRPFGWRPVPHPSGRGVTLALDEEEAALLRDAVERVLRGNSIRSIASAWNERGIKTTTGKTWHPSRLRAQLANPLLMGHRTEDKKVVLDEEGLPVQHYPALLTADTFLQLQGRLAARTKAPTKTQGSLLAGIAKCGLCGGPMSGVGAASQNANAAYKCSKREGRGTSVCPGVAVRQSRLDEQVVEWTTRFLTTDAAETVLAVHTPPTEAAARVAAIELRLVRARELYLEGAFTRSEYDAECRKYEPALNKARESQLDAEQAPALRLRLALGSAPEELGDLALGEYLREHWDELDRPQQRSIVGAVFQRIEVGPSPHPRGMKGVPRAERWNRQLERLFVYFAAWEGQWGVLGPIVQAVLEQLGEYGPEDAQDYANDWQSELEHQLLTDSPDLFGGRPLWWQMEYAQRLELFAVEAATE